MSETKENTSTDCQDDSLQSPTDVVEKRKKNRNSENFRDESKKDFAILDKMDSETLERLKMLEGVEENGQI